MGKYKNLAKDTLIFAIGSFGQKFIQFFLVPLYTNFLSTEEYGISDLIFTIAELAIPFLFVVIYDSVLRFGVSNQEDKSNVFVSSLFIWIIGSLACFALIPIMNLYQAIKPWKWYLTIYIVIAGLNDILINFLKATSRNKLYSLMSIVKTLLLGLLNILLICVFKLGIYGYVLSTLIGSFAALVITLILSRSVSTIKRGRVDWALLKRMLLYSSPLILNNISWWIIHSSDKIMIESMLDANALGIYTVAIKVPALINIITSIFQQAWNLSAIKEHETSDDRCFYSNIFSLFSTTVFGAVLILNCIIKPFMNIYVGESFQTAWRFIPFLLLGSAFSAIAQFYTGIYSAFKKSVNIMCSMLIGAVLNLVLNFILIARVGVWGAVVATVISFFSIAVVRIIDSQKYIKFEINYIVFSLSIIVILAQTIITVLFGSVIVSSLFVPLYLIVNYNQIKKLIKVAQRFCKKYLKW